MPYYPDPYAGISAGINSATDSLTKAITGYYEDKDKGDFANRMMDEFMKIPGAVPEDIMSKFPKMSSTQKSDALVAVQWRMHRADQQVKEERAKQDQDWQNRINAVTYNAHIADAATKFAQGPAPQLGQQVPLPGGQAGTVTSVPGGGSMTMPPEPKASPTPRAGQVDLDPVTGRPRVDLDRNIFYSGGVPMILTGDMRKQFVEAQGEAGDETKDLEGRIQRQQSKMGKPLASSRYGSREAKLADLQSQRQSKLGLFGQQSAPAAPAASPSPAAGTLAPDRVNVISPPDATGRRKSGTVPLKNLQPWLKANPGWSVVPATVPAPTPPPAGPNQASLYGAPGKYKTPEEQDLEDLLMT